MFQEKVYHNLVAFRFSLSIQDAKLLESSTSSYLVVESSSGYLILVTVSTSSYFKRIS